MESCLDVSRHREYVSALGVVLIKVDAEIIFACPTEGELVLFLSAWMRWLASVLVEYLTPKLSTTRVNMMLFVSCFHREGVRGTG